MQKNEKVTITITGMSAEGSGIGRTKDGMAVFVPVTAIGDTVTAHIVKEAKTYAFGKLEKIIQPSEHRIEADCHVFDRCGGCVFRHISYEEESRVKWQRVKDAFARIGGFSNDPMPIMKAKNPNHYRNKAQMPVGIDPKDKKIKAGFYQSRSHRIADSSHCKLQPALFGQVTEIIKQFLWENNISVYDENTGKGYIRHIYLRSTRDSGQIMICLVVNGNGLPKELVLTEMLKEKLAVPFSLIINSNREKTNVILGKKYRTVYGPDTITDTLCGCEFSLSPASFYQVNPEQAEKLYEKAMEYAGLTEKEILLDLYCGTGTIGLCMAKKAKEVIGVELVPQAIEDAIQNAERNNIKNARFICDDAAGAAQTLLKEGIKPDIIVVDPPRKGCEPELLQTIADMAPKKIVYVSCDPATCARDIKALTKQGYTLTEYTPLDMFPRTAHVETIVLLQRQNT